MNIALIISLTLFDCFFWHYLHEVKGWNLFWELTYKGRTIYPIYRLIQGLLDLGAIYLLYDPNNLFPVIGFVIAWWAMAKEAAYYILLNQWRHLKDGEDYYWLARIWFTGFFLFRKGFNKTAFLVCFIVSILILVISNLI